MEAARVILGVDFSGVMMRAAPWLRDHIVPGAQLIVVHAAERPDIPPFLRALMPPDEKAQAAALRSDIARLCEWRRAAGVNDARLVVREGRADQVLRDVAAENHAVLVVIGAHGGRERPWMRLGTTAERLLRAAETSLLVVRGPMLDAPRRIVVALDDAGITPRVLETAGALGDRLEARLHAVHVLSNAAYSHVLSAEASASSDRAEASRNVERDVAAEALRWLQALWQNTHRHGKLEIDVPHGDPSTEILRAAEASSADLIVIGRYGVGRKVPAFLGSVVGSVVHGADCPVLVVGDAATQTPPTQS